MSKKHPQHFDPDWNGLIIEKTKSGDKKQLLLEVIEKYSLRILAKEGYFYPLILTNPMEVVYENE